ncbi:MAG: hypothetical protein SGARI_002370 [Bacillariaceae sp.]
MSCLAKDSNNILLLDELCHNSIQMGIRLGRKSGIVNGQVQTFQHNNVHALEDKLKQIRHQTESLPLHSAATLPNVIIVIESIYSMDGDMAPMQAIFDLAAQYHACVVVDEAHGLGVCGKSGLGLLQQFHLERHPCLLCSVFTFGKAAGCHGAVVCGSSSWIQFLYNYGRPIVYSTSLPLHALVSIECAYDTMTDAIVGKQLREKVTTNVKLFRKLIHESVLKFAMSESIALVESFSPIQALIIPGNHQCMEFCQRLYQRSNKTIKLFPIRSPTVPRGMERQTLAEMNLIKPSNASLGAGHKVLQSKL